MYGLRRNTDLSFFSGRTLVQMCFGMHDLVLNFDGSVSVTVTSRVEIGAHDHSMQIEQFIQSAPVLLALVNRVVVTAVATEAGTLELGFDNGEVLRFVDDSHQYESYVVRSGQEVIVV